MNIKLIYVNTNHGSNLDCVAIYSTEESDVVTLIDHFLLGHELKFMDLKCEILGTVGKNEPTCGDAIHGYHEEEDDLMLDCLEGDPDFNNIDIYQVGLNLDETTSKVVISNLKDYAERLNIKFIQD